MHLNIRFLNNKIIEIKNIVKQHDPHILGLSECELRNVEGPYDETKLKVPGYILLLPKSWEVAGFARVAVILERQ